MKIIALIRGSASETYSDFGKRIHAVAEEIRTRIAPSSLWLTITETAPPKLTIIPFKKGKIAAISTITDHPDQILQMLDVRGFAGLYEADEAIPVAYEKTWQNGEVTPGSCLLTLFRQKPGITYDRFLDRWHNSHTPLSLKIHPLWHYNRNVVQPYYVPEGGMIWDGIVEEHFRTSSDLLNPFRFFGNPLVILQRMLHVYTDTNSFLEYKSIEPWLVREYRIV